MKHVISDLYDTRYWHTAWELIFGAITLIAGIILIYSNVALGGNTGVTFITGFFFIFSIVAIVILRVDPDSVRARQSDAMLILATQTLDCMKRRGLDTHSSQEICELLLPATAAIAVAITDREHILGYAGYNQENNPPGAPIRTVATHSVLADGKERVLYSHDEIGLPFGTPKIEAAIIAPLMVGDKIEGTLKFYYRKATRISATQRSIAEGFGRLLSTQMAATVMEEQAELATSMELKALQAQINPHFLFNTLNTIASFIRTDPDQARRLIREFAVFYRQTLENSSDLIMLVREIEQTRRYFMFEIARFGSDRVELVCDINPELNDLMVPSFLIQPLVENAVRHAMPSEGKLTVTVKGRYEGEDAILSVSDNGVGMSEEERSKIMHPESSKGLGIAVKNVRDRLKGYFGSASRMDVESELGVGTTVTLVLSRAMHPEEARERYEEVKDKGAIKWSDPEDLRKKNTD
ncbi:MAG: histidine kinase [Eggerthellaceae bacterium]|jgi:two-component system sensor histidine kinase LytS